MSRVLYVETSAVLRIAIEEDRTLLPHLAKARRLVTSALTRVEALRTLRRGERERRIDGRQLREKHRWVTGLMRSCEILPLDEATLERASLEFPVEPVRALDAIHLASMLGCMERIGRPVMVSCDARVRENALALGIDVLPARLPK